jgi:ABC-type nitrate/sulfonate/bicarbonate transport system substrate-binding protein
MKRSTFAASAASLAGAAPTILRAQPLPTIRLGTFPSESYALAIYGKEQGFFQQNGLNVTVTYVTGAVSGGITAAVVGGALEVGVISMGPVANGVLHGVPMKLIAPGGISEAEHPTTSLVTAKNSAIATAKDLNGKTVCTYTLKDLSQLAQAKWIDVNGGDSKTVKFLELSPGDTPAAISSGRVDAGSIAEPMFTNMKDDFKVLGGVFGAIARRCMLSMCVAMSDWLDKNGDAARRFALAMRQTAQWANANRPQAEAILSRESKIPPDVVRRMNHVVYSETLDLTTIQPQIDGLAEYKYIDKRFNVADIVWSGARA